MPIGPKECNDILNAKDQLEVDTLVKDLDYRLKHGYNGGKSFTINMTTQIYSRIQDKIRQVYVAAGWSDVKFGYVSDQRENQSYMTITFHA